MLESEKVTGSALHFKVPFHENGDDYMANSTQLPASSIQYSCDDSTKIAFTTIIGEINLQVLQSELSLIWSGSSYNPDYSVMVDIRQAFLRLETNDIPLVLELFSAMPVHKKNRKFAMLTATPQQVAFSTMFGQNIKNKYPFIVEIFSTYEAGINWLGV